MSQAQVPNLVRDGVRGMFYRFVAPATLSQATPVQNTWYTVVDTSRPVKVYTIMWSVATANEDIEIKVTMNGVSETDTQSATAATLYREVYHQSSSTARWLGASSSTQTSPLLIEGVGLKVEIRKTSANGAGTITARIHYEELS